MRIVDAPGGCWPDARQQRLLKAALLGGPEAAEAWTEWVAEAGLDRLDQASFRLLPLVGRNLQAQGFRDAHTSTLRGVHRRAWCENQVLFHKMAATLAEFRRASIDTLLLKGAALAVLHYRDCGLRPMRDFDVLVPEEQAQAALGVLDDAGWRPDRRLPRKLDRAFTSFRHSICMHHPDGREIDLHWHALYWCCYPGADREFWEHSVPLEIGGVSTRALSAEDELIVTCAHGVVWSEPPPIRWIADAVAILRASPSFDWSRVLDFAARNRLVLPFRYALGYLKTFGTPVPAGVLDSLERLPVTRIDRIEYQRATEARLQSPLATFLAVHRHFRRSVPGAGLGHRALGFARYLRYYWNFDRPWKVAPQALRWGALRLARRRAAAGGVPSPR